MYTTKAKKIYRNKLEKSETQKHKDKDVVGEFLALDPNHKPRGGYKQLLKVLLDDYAVETE